jgi:branched-chain amino acid transport system permease protein
MSQLIWNGLFVGSFYALVALGYSMVYGIIKLLNFAHGDIYMLGAFAGYAALTIGGSAASSLGLAALAVVLVLAMVLTGTFGLLLEMIAYRPLRNAPRLSVLITAVGASFALEYGMRQLAGPNPQVYPVRLSARVFNLLGARISFEQVGLVVVAVVLMLALQWLVMGTGTGRAMRAISMDPKGALLMGINVNKVIARTFFLGSAPGPYSTQAYDAVRVAAEAVKDAKSTDGSKVISALEAIDGFQLFTGPLKFTSDHTLSNGGFQILEVRNGTFALKDAMTS